MKPTITVIVLLSTYNGERYLTEQLDSILQQKDVNVILLIRDDGSLDRTNAIIGDYQAMYPQKIYLFKGNNIGCAASFRWLMEKALDMFPSADCYAFSDQDDIWELDKLKIASEALALQDDKMPNLFFSQFQKVDSSNNAISTEAIRFKHSFGEALVMNPSVGCTQVFNKRLLFECLKGMPPALVLHDWWMYCVCLALSGNVTYYAEPLVRYRQHAMNVIGSKRMTKVEKLKNWLFHKNNSLCSNLSASLFTYYKEKMLPENLELTRLAMSYKQSIQNRFKLIFKRNKFKTISSDVNCGFVLSVICGKF